MIILSLLLAVLIFIYFLSNKDKHYLWFETYRANSEEPYGTLFIQKMLEDYRQGEDFTLSQIPLRSLLADVDDKANTDYVFIGQNMFLDSDSHTALVELLDEGGNVFIASLTPPADVISSVYYPECDSLVSLKDNFADTVRFNFFHDELRHSRGYDFAYRYGSDVQKYYWNYFDEALFCDSTALITPLGYQDDGKVNFIRISTGKGNLYLHSNPLVFTNYFLINEENVSYASAVFSHLDGKQIIWDEYSKIPFAGNNNAYNSPLYYIMGQPSLKYAWWLLLLAVVLYIFFAAKRKQRVIPVIEPKTNSSLEFVNLISRLHYKNGNHLDMAHKKMKYFLYFVRSKYGIHAEKFKEEQIRKLSEKSRVAHGEVETIFHQYHLIEDRFKENIEANRLVNLYDAIDNFYKQCK